MRTTKLFKCGNSMAVRLPKDFSLHGSEVEIKRQGNDIIIREIPSNLSKAFELLCSISEDFFAEGRNDLPPQDRNF